MRDPWTLSERQRRVRGWICRLTDHAYDWHPQQPYCLRCGGDCYYPARVTVGALVWRVCYRLREWWRWFGVIRRCEHCGLRWGRHGEDCIPF